MPLLILQIVLEGLKTFNLIYADVPLAERQQAFKDWCEFCKPFKDTIRNLRIDGGPTG